MSINRTQQQTTEDVQRSEDLSLEERKPPLELPGYSLQQFLGSGAYGEVWAGIDRKTGRKVAVKFYTRKTSLDFSMLSREVEKLVFLAANRYVVQLLDVGWTADPAYYVMDFIENGSLEEELKRRSTIPLPEALELFEEIAIGLMHLHNKGILHCDLKPGNVLLDQDLKPRLADFGQSRLSTEEAPALGTLFFMAPEQADMKAAPDAKWDVYALGALLYCMITGHPPYRTDECTRELEAKDSLEARLSHYKQLIRKSPKPTGHRQVKGMDKWLDDIIQRCIHPDPKQRFPSIQSVLQAIRQRKETLSRRPLMVLGVIGPLLLLLLMSGFAWWGYQDAVNKSKQEFMATALERNTWAAMFAARTVSESINNYFSVVQRKSQTPEFRELFQQYLENSELQELAVQLADPNFNDSTELDPLREQFRAEPGRSELNRLLEDWYFDESLPPAASWFVCDRYGNQVAAVWDERSDPVNTIGKNWSYRSYFHSGEHDLAVQNPDGSWYYPVAEDINARDHITGEEVSAVFKSRATYTWKVAFSVPIFIDGEFQGVVAVTVEMGEFIRFEDGVNQYAMLVNGRRGVNQGIVLEHPVIRAKMLSLEPDEKLPDAFSNVRLDLSQFDGDTTIQFTDPMGYDPRQRGDAQQWIAAAVTVWRESVTREGRAPMVDTGLMVVAVEDAATVLKPVGELGRRMVGLGLVALLAFVLVTGGLAIAVFRSLRQSKLQAAQVGSPPGDPSSLHDAQTMPASDQGGSTS